MKKLFLIVLLLAQPFFLLAQETDSLVFVKAHWSKEKVAKKTRLITHHFDQKNLFSANQNISYLEIKASKRAPIIAIGNEVKELMTTADFGNEHKAFAAINGTFFDVKNGGSVDFVRVGGRTANENRLGKNAERAIHQEAAIVIDDVALTIKKWDGGTNWEEKLVEKDVMVTGPLLIYDHKNEMLDSVAFNKLRHPRSAVGTKPNGNVILLTIDGRNENSVGASLFELTKIMRWLGCRSAINLDGGGSTTLWVKDATKNGVVNYPSDNKKWDHEGMRKVANVILLKQKKQ